MSDHDRIIILLTRRIAGELTAAEAEELQLALEQDALFQELASAMEGVSDAPPKGMTTKEERWMVEKGLRQWKQRMDESPVSKLAVVAAEPDEAVGPVRRSRDVLVRWWAIAAAVLLVVAGGYLFRSKSYKKQEAASVVWREMTAKYGTRNYLEMQDGSKLWLNAGTKVRYAEGKRALLLWGEAFFDIKHDAEHPFEIYVGGVTVKVLGTSLNIKAYPGDSSIETTLIQGKVEIDVPGKGGAPITLRPSEKVTLYTASRTIGSKKSGVDSAVAESKPSTYQRQTVTADPTYKTIIETSWVEDKLVFRKEKFREVATKLERWYNIRIHFSSDKYLDDELTGYFKDQPIKNVMDALQLSLGFHYELAGDSILIK